MKKQNIILAAVSLLALFSCNKEVDVIPSDTKEEAWEELLTYTMSITAGKADSVPRAVAAIMVDIAY